MAHEREEDGILQQERMILKNRMKLQMEIGRRGILPEEKLFSTDVGVTYGKFM